MTDHHCRSLRRTGEILVGDRIHLKQQCCEVRLRETQNDRSAAALRRLGLATAASLREAAAAAASAKSLVGRKRLFHAIAAASLVGTDGTRTCVGAAGGVDLRPVILAAAAAAAGAIDLGDAGDIARYALAAVASLGAIGGLVAVEDALGVEPSILARRARAAAAALGKTAGIAVVVVSPFCRRRRAAITIAAAGAYLAVGVRSRFLGGESAATTAAVCDQRGAVGQG